MPPGGSVMDPKYLLITPPITDPTSPYHSLAYLMGHAKSKGFKNGMALDLNISVFDVLSKPNHVESLIGLADSILSSNIDENPTRLDIMRYAIAAEAKSMTATDVLDAISVLKSEQHFFDFETYIEAIEVLEKWQLLLSIKGIPGQFKNFSLDTRSAANLNNSFDVSNRGYLSLVNAPLEPGYVEALDQLLQAKQFDLIGLSINYISQLPFALEVLRRCRLIQPDATLIAGGTDVSDIVKYSNDMTAVWRIFSDCDALVVGEGESAFIRILTSISEGNNISSGPGIAVAKQPQKPPYYNENLKSLGHPDYSVHDVDVYWAPFPVLLYSPTRGCYWNKCTFCDYGLNFDMPTSPSREVPADKLAQDLETISKVTPYVYFAVDAMSPSFLKRMCHTISANSIYVQWSAELRLEPKISDSSLATALKDAGCVAVSFGLESGSQRILDLIDKGVNLVSVPDVLSALNSCDIGAQLMAFTGFPSETVSEANATYDFLKEHRDNWALSMVGEFGLTMGAIVAKKPHLFGVHRVFAAEGDDIPRQMLWEDGEGATRDRAGVLGLSRPSLPVELQAAPLDRPWVGGIDAAHSILYFARNGASLLKSEEKTHASTHSISRLVSQEIEQARQLFTELRNERDKFISSGRVNGGYSRGLSDMMEWYSDKISIDFSPAIAELK